MRVIIWHGNVRTADVTVVDGWSAIRRQSTWSYSRLLAEVACEAQLPRNGVLGDVKVMSSNATYGQRVIWDMPATRAQFQTSSLERVVFQRRSHDTADGNNRVTLTRYLPFPKTTVACGLGGLCPRVNLTRLHTSSPIDRETPDLHKPTVPGPARSGRECALHQGRRKCL